MLVQSDLEDDPQEISFRLREGELLCLSNNKPFEWNSFAIAAGIGLKQNLFDGVLSNNNRMDEVDFSASGRAQFLAELELIMNEMVMPQPLEESAPEEKNMAPEQISEDDITSIIKEEDTDQAPEETPASAINPESDIPIPPQMQQMEQVMQNGMNFLSGLYQMATGKAMAPEDQKISIDH